MCAPAEWPRWGLLMDLRCFREKANSALFFKYNTQLGPPYYILLDTNFINMSVQNKLEIVQASMDCLYAKCASPS